MPRSLIHLAVLGAAVAAACPGRAAAQTLAVDAGVAPPPVAREFRAAWVSPVSGPDWPSAPGLPRDSQIAELRALLDDARAVGLNAVVFHVRAAADAFYPTPLAPWTAFLTGVSGRDPGYDPLAVAIAEAHARGLQFHAWFNPFRAMLPNFAGAAAPTHVTRAHPTWVRKYGTQTWIDPGEPAARAAVLEAMLDVVRRYDVDGVHIDDYFYPYLEDETVRKRVRRRVRGKMRTVTVTSRRTLAFPDDATWKRYGAPQGFKTRGDWRRANVNDFIAALYRAVKAEKPWVPVGISPFGIWKSGTPRGITGLDAYSEIFADSRTWFTKGWLDYLAPQLYWPLAGAQRRFLVLDRWWRDENVLGRHIWPGLQTDLAVTAWSPAEIPNEIAALRAARVTTALAVPNEVAAAPEAQGHVHFRMRALRPAAGPLGATLRATLYAEPALVPAFPWLADADAPEPAAPRLAAASSADSVTVAPGDAAPVAWWLVQARSADGRWTAALRRAAPGAGPQAVALPDALNGGRADRVAVTGIDRVGRGGAAAVVRW